ncbi:MAG: threonine synthase [Gemmatimonadetes bacterium]|nr:threonine synthase [Gemmatimonadota bacterium]MBI2616394.1 threonine synthase [Gemmatimonadota bacterium]
MTSVTAPTLRALPQHCPRCKVEYQPAPVAICESCLGPLEPAYPSERAFPDRETIAKRPPSMWRYREWLPFDGEPRLSRETGFTPLFQVPSLAELLGVARLWVKNDSVSHPSLSFKDRVVASAINAADALGIEVVGCASTGNLANAVAAHAARAKLPAWIFVPEDLELGKLVGTSAYGARLVRVRGTYDDVNRLCVQVADRFGWGVVNVNLRGYYGEGSKTVGFEIAEQLGWRLPTAVVVPMAGGSLISKIKKSLEEFRAAGLVSGRTPRLFGAQAEGCAPIVRLVERGVGGIEPVVPRTIARSIAIGNPADGAHAAEVIRETGGWAAAVTDAELVAGIRLLAEHAGVFTETAGGVTVAAARKLAQAGRLTRDDEVVLCITGNGLKTVEAVRDALPEAPVIAARIKEVAALVEAAA